MNNYYYVEFEDEYHIYVTVSKIDVFVISTPKTADVELLVKRMNSAYQIGYSHGKYGLTDLF